MKAIKIGDVVAWADVPDGALVRETLRGESMYQRCVGDQGWLRRKKYQVVGAGVEPGTGMLHPWTGEPRRPWREAPGRVTIIALGLTGEETADDLRALAEVFEVREALVRFPAIGGVDDIAAVGNPAELAERLHAVGWRPGDTAERAALLLRMHELVQVGESDDARLLPAWEAARDLVDCPLCEAPAGANCCCVFDDGGLGELDDEVHVERLDGWRVSIP